eukprot:Selendium_serpulae@DN6578_c0_g1_i1.p3
MKWLVICAISGGRLAEHNMCFIIIFKTYKPLVRRLGSIVINPTSMEDKQSDMLAQPKLLWNDSFTCLFPDGQAVAEQFVKATELDNMSDFGVFGTPVESDQLPCNHATKPMY